MKIGLGVLDHVHDGGGDAGGAHLGLLVVGAHVAGAGDLLLDLAGERVLAVIVEEKGDVRGLFALGAAELRQPGLREHVAQDVRHLRRLLEGDVRLQARLVAGHRAEIQVLRDGPAVEPAALDGGPRGVVVHEGLGDLAGAVAAEVEEDHAVAVGDPAGVSNIGRRNCGGGDELVAGAVGVGGLFVIVLQHLHGGGAGRPAAADEQIIRPLDAVPAEVAVHGVEPADDAGDRGEAAVGELRLDLRDVGGPAGGGGVPAVGDRVDRQRLLRESRVGA